MTFSLTVNVRRIHLERDEHVGWGDLILVGDTDDNIVFQERRVVRTERRVGRDDDTGLCARSKDVILKTRSNRPQIMRTTSGFTERCNLRMALNLIHSGNYGGDFKQLLEIGDRHV